MSLKLSAASLARPRLISMGLGLGSALQWVSNFHRSEDFLVEMQQAILEGANRVLDKLKALHPEWNVFEKVRCALPRRYLSTVIIFPFFLPLFLRCLSDTHLLYSLGNINKILLPQNCWFISSRFLLVLFFAYFPWLTRSSLSGNDHVMSSSMNTT